MELGMVGVRCFAVHLAVRSAKIIYKMQSGLSVLILRSEHIACFIMKNADTSSLDIESSQCYSILSVQFWGLSE